MRRHWIEAGWLIFVRLASFQIIGNSLYPEEFESFVEKWLSSRQLKIINFNHLSIQVAPELAHLLSNSKMVSSIGYRIIIVIIAHKGRSHLLLNRSKKFERAAKQNAEKGEKEALKTQISLLKEEVKLLKDELQVSEFDRFEAEKNRDLLGQLYDQNVIDREGKPI